MKRNCTSNLYQLRVRSGLSQTDLANDLQISQSLLSLWENNKRKPSEEMLEKLKRYFHLVNEFDLF